MDDIDRVSVEAAAASAARVLVDVYRQPDPPRAFLVVHDDAEFICANADDAVGIIRTLKDAAVCQRMRTSA